MCMFIKERESAKEMRRRDEGGRIGRRRKHCVKFKMGHFMGIKEEG